MQSKSVIRIKKLEWDKKNNSRKFDFLDVYEQVISELISASFQSDSKSKTFVMLTSLLREIFKGVLRITTLLIGFGFLDDCIKKLDRTLQSNAKCDLINQFNSKINFCNQDPFCQETRVLLLGVSPLIRCQFPFPRELVGSEYFDVFLMHLSIDICGYFLLAQKGLSFKFAHCLILQYYFSPCQKTYALIQSAEN